MRISSERLAAEAATTGFRPEILEKVIHLLDLLESIQSHPYLRGRVVLKGGTALNLFIFSVPRLSVDVDLNYIGSGKLAVMLEERPRVDEGLQAVFSRGGYQVSREPDQHAGGKWRLRYDSATGQGGNLEVDINYMYRIPLWPVTERESHGVGSYSAAGIPVLDVHELAAGKLTALFARTSGRDLFDTHRLLTQINLDVQKLRLGFIVYDAMNRLDWRSVSIEDVAFEERELVDQLLPMLGRDETRDEAVDAEWAARMLDETREALATLLPFASAEHEFLDRLLDRGEIDADLLTDNEALQARIEAQPWLHWKAQHVRKHKLD